MKKDPEPAELGNLAGAGANFQSAKPEPFFFALGNGFGAPEPCRSPSLGAMTPEPL